MLLCAEEHQSKTKQALKGSLLSIVTEEHTTLSSFVEINL